MQVTHERREGTGPEVDPDEPQQLRHHDEGVARDAGPRRRDATSGPTGRRRRRVATQTARKARVGRSRRVARARKNAAYRPRGSRPPALERLERVRVGHAPDEEEERHDLEQPGQWLEGRHDRERVRDLPVGRDRDHEPVPEDHDEERPDAEGVDPAVPVGGRRGVDLGGRAGRRVGVGPAHVSSKHGRRPAQVSSPAQATVRGSAPRPRTHPPSKGHEPGSGSWPFDGRGPGSWPSDGSRWCRRGARRGARRPRRRRPGARRRRERHGAR